MSKFKRNQAPGWKSSDEEESSEEGEASSSDEEEDRNASKRYRGNDQMLTGPIASTGADSKSTVKKFNPIWSDVLVDQQLSGGISCGVSVMSGDTFVPRGSETYDCAKTKEVVDGDSERKQVVAERKQVVAEATMEQGKEELDDDPFAGEHYEAPDMMADLSDKRNQRGNFNGNSRKRPWQRGGMKRYDKDRGDQSQSAKDSAQADDHGSRRGGRGQWNGPRGGGGGRGRGRGHFRNDRSHSGGRRHIERISLKEEDVPKEIALAIARSLHEVKTDLMTRVVECVGVKKAINLYNRTVDIENSGGLMTLDNRRRRTSGGVFLYLLRDDPEITEAQKDQLFGADRDEYRQQLIAKRRLQKQAEEGETSKMEIKDGEKPLKDAKEVFLEEAVKESKSVEDVLMDG